MTSTDLAIVDSYARASLDERQRYANMIAGAGALLSQSVRAQGAAGVFLMAETGAMLGIHPVAALQGVHVIDGKPTLSANLLAALVRRAGHTLRISTSGAWADGSFVARAVLIRADDPTFEFVVEWTKAKAQSAGLLGKRGPWQSYPEAMCKSRAITEVIREGASDVTIIPAYSPEELGADNVDESGELIVVNETKHEPQSTPAQNASPAAASDALPQSNIVDAVTMSSDYIERVSAAGSADEVLAIFREGRERGELNAQIEVGDYKGELGAWIISIGKRLKEAEAEHAAESDANVDDVVVAEIVDDETPAVLDESQS